MPAKIKNLYEWSGRLWSIDELVMDPEINIHGLTRPAINYRLRLMKGATIEQVFSKPPITSGRKKKPVLFGSGDEIDTEQRKTLKEFDRIGDFKSENAVSEIS